MNIKLLDCTLRDGGYINDWNFTNNTINQIINSLEKANIDILECGYLNENKGKLKDSTLFKNLETINLLLSNRSINMQKVVMINFGDYDIDNLENKSKTTIDGIRLAFHKKDLEDVLKTSRKIIKLGYKLYFQPMVTKSYSDLEFLTMISKVNHLKPYAFYIVDSFGSITLEEFNRYLILSHNNLNNNISLGYHAHNNMQLAFSNAVSMCVSNINRDIIIDASIHGIGRGAGNLNTELIANYLNKNVAKDYDTLPLLEIIDELFSYMMRKSSWGFSPAQFLSASYNCHPNYATFLINKNTNHIVGVKKILEKLPSDKKYSFDKDYIEKLYIDSVLEPKAKIKDDIELDIKKNVLLLASGKSINYHHDLIKSKIDDTNYIVIALNHMPKFDCNYILFTNQKRFDEFSTNIEVKNTIVTNNIDTDMNIKNVLDFSKFALVNNKLVTNIAIIAINILIGKAFKSVEIAGLDGYKVDYDNYNYNGTTFITDKKAIEEENKNLNSSLKLLKSKINIDFLTPSIFQNIESLKIIGVIPARYKSSRFEGKPLCIIKNIPMIKRTYNQAKKSKLLNKLVVATDNDLIKTYCESEKIPVIMTSEECMTGTDRIVEVSKTEHFDLYVNIQGDEPVIDERSINEVVSEFKKYRDKYIAYNLYKSINDKDEIHSDTIIKVIVNKDDELMYMSRQGVPFNKSNKKAIYKKQVCVYGFTKKALQVFSSLNKTVNEQYEDIEILRFLDMGYKVKMKETRVNSIAVDIPTDVKKVEKFLDENGLD